MLKKALLWIALGILPTTVMASQNSSSINVVSEENPQFTVQLPANTGSTGYSWYLTGYNSQLLQPVSYHYANPSSASGMLGTPETAIFVFKATPALLTVPQKTGLTFSYLRPWENNPGQTKLVTVLSITTAPQDVPVRKGAPPASMVILSSS